jgi:hypothetical protein
LHLPLNLEGDNALDSHGFDLVLELFVAQEIIKVAADTFLVHSLTPLDEGLWEMNAGKTNSATVISR